MRWSSNFKTHSTCFHHWVTSYQLVAGNKCDATLHFLEAGNEWKASNRFCLPPISGHHIVKESMIGCFLTPSLENIARIWGGASTRQNYWLMVGSATHSKMLHKPIYWHYHFHWILLSDITCCENDGPIQTYSEMTLCFPPKMGVNTYQDDLLSNQNGSKLMASNGFPSNKLNDYWKKTCFLDLSKWITYKKCDFQWLYC